MFEIDLVEKIKTRVLFPITLFSEDRAVYEIMSKNVVEPERPQITIWRCFACWISKAIHAQAHTLGLALTPTRTRAHSSTHTHSEKYIILLFHGNSSSANALRCHVMRTMSVLI
jgi:hypothetical protein